jgi:hypothetical protein
MTVDFDGLTEISLANNKLGDRGVADLASALYQDIWLVGLDLRMNGIGVPGFKEIESLLQTNKTLLYVDIRDNNDV